MIAVSIKKKKKYETKGKWQSKRKKRLKKPSRCFSERGRRRRRMFLKEMVSSIAPALTLIYQASYEQGQIPDDSKSAFVTPLFKKGHTSKAANYRTVSRTSCCCKVMEHIVHSHLMICYEVSEKKDKNKQQQQHSERLPAWLQEEEIL